MDMTFSAKMGMRVSPRLVAANRILELSSLELQQAIAEELADNPALEKVRNLLVQYSGRRCRVVFVRTA
jgi:DNA-directed RNA polymerase specialized sigma54-like protein